MIKYTPSNMRMWSRFGPSGAFAIAAMELAEVNENIVMFSADMSFVSGLERFKNKYPERHFEFGIAEQNMVGAAAGMASEGFMPYVVTYATFFSCRALDQIKMCLGYMQKNVKLVGMMSGLTSGILGPTHMGIEDISIMRTIPGITILSPADGMEMVKAILVAAEVEGPVYIRLSGGMNLPMVYDEDYDFKVGRAVKLCEGKDVTIFATGTMVHYAMEAAELLSQENIMCTVINMHTIKPIDIAAIDEARNAKLIATVEEHSVIGGLGSAVAEHLLNGSSSSPLLRLGVRDVYPKAGSYEYLLDKCGLTAEKIAKSIAAYFKGE